MRLEVCVGSNLAQLRGEALLLFEEAFNRFVHLMYISSEIGSQVLMTITRCVDVE